MTFIVLSLLAAYTHSISLAFLSGVILAMTLNASHNFIHMKTNWRTNYMDLTLQSSYDWRISHALSHHLYPNTVLVRFFIKLVKLKAITLFENCKGCRNVSRRADVRFQKLTGKELDPKIPFLCLCRSNICCYAVGCLFEQMEEHYLWHAVHPAAGVNRFGGVIRLLLRHQQFHRWLCFLGLDSHFLLILLWIFFIYGRPSSSYYLA